MKKRPIHVNILTTGKEILNVYSENIINNVDITVSDNSVIDANQTQAKQGCSTRGKKIRRGGRNRKHIMRHCSGYLKLFSTNAASVINGKQESLNSEIICTKSNVVTLQETHAPKKGKIAIPNFVIFEAIRKRKGGGTLVAAHEDLNPKLISEYDDDFEILVVEIETKEKSIRIISGYGPQENWEEEKRLPFFLALETEVEKAELAGKSIVIELDANSKLGPEYIPNDPHEMSPNGFLLSGIINRHALCVANGSEKSRGTITRRRVTKDRTEESVIDIVMFSHDMNPNFVSLKVDEAKIHVLKSIRKCKKGIKIKESDHNIIETEFNCKINDAVIDKKHEFFNLKNKDCQKAFKQYTSNTNMFTNIFDNEGDLNSLTEKFINKLNGCIAQTFKKIRVSGRKQKQIETLYKKLRYLKDKTDAISVKEAIEVENEIANHTEENYNKLKTQLETMESKAKKTLS